MSYHQIIGDKLYSSWSLCVALADAFFAPVAVRLRTYRVEVPAKAASYIETLYQWPAFKAWQQAGLAERAG